MCIQGVGYPLVLDYYMLHYIYTYNCCVFYVVYTLYTTVYIINSLCRLIRRRENYRNSHNPNILEFVPLTSQTEVIIHQHHLQTQEQLMIHT